MTDPSNASGMIAPLEVGLCVENLERARTFYEDILGFAFVSSIPTPAEHATESGICRSGYTVVRLQLPTGERLKLFAPDEPPQPHATGEPPLSRRGYAYITLIVSDLHVLLRRLKENGIHPRAPGIYALRQNVIVSLVDDPEGNVVELVEYKDIALYRPDL